MIDDSSNKPIDGVQISQVQNIAHYNTLVSRAHFCGGRKS